MKSLLLASTSLLCFSFAHGSEPVLAKPQPVTVTLQIGGIECPSCVALVQQSLQDVVGMIDLDVRQQVDSYAVVTFDPAKATLHQIAQAISEAYPLHGKPYTATLQLTLPEYSQPAIAAQVDALFAKQKAWVDIIVADKSKGECLLNFNELETEKAKTKRQGWDHQAFLHSLTDPKPKGLGLKVQLSTEGQAAKP